MKKVLIFCAIAIFVGIALFYTPKYTKFNKADWDHERFNGSYDRREQMLPDLLKNYPLKGMNVPQLRNLFGSNNVDVMMIHDTLEIGMKIATEYGRYPSWKYLILYLDKDSVVTSWKVKKTR